MKAAEWLMARGYTNVSNLDGGMNAWTAASLPLFEHPAQ
jgi:rhodanese-related sulfurtransferase